MNQLTMADIEYSNRKKKTKREEFLDACASNKSIVDCKKYKELTKNTYGLLLYQEQIIHILKI